MQITVDCSNVKGTLAPFWRSTGFTPATLLLTNDMRQQLVYLGSIPRQGIKYVRIHYLLELVDVTFEDENAVQYDWSRLDRGMDLLVENNLIPLFEIMGNPGGQFSSFRDDLQLRRWRNLIHDLALHLMERYGREAVEGWLFETWNEPDGGFGWRHEWPQDEVSFCNYYDATAAGLWSANPELTLGGPGSCRTLSSLFRAFVAHCDSGKNYFSGETGTRLDFISIHEKGIRPNKEDVSPRTYAMLDREVQIINYLREHHPRLAKLPFMNNECDPIVGWKDYHTWHARPYYAAWIAKSNHLHQTRLVEGMGVDYALLGNDHGFIGAWGMRTLLARFGVDNWIHDGQGGHAELRGWEVREFDTPNFAMIKKPAFNAMTLCSLLAGGESEAHNLAYQIRGELAQPAADAELGVMATRVGEAVAVLVYYSRDKILSTGSERVELRLENLPFERAMLAHYRIDEEHGDPFNVWEDAGAPQFPDEKLLAAMRDAQELALLQAPAEVEPRQGCLDVNFDLPLHGVSLLLLQPQPAQPPEIVTGLRVEAFTGLQGQPEYLLRWNPLESRAVQTYEVLRSAAPAGPFVRVNPTDLLCSAYMVTEEGYYQVRARDFWSRTGGASLMLKVG